MKEDWLDDVDESGFTQAQRFREEIESPFRKVRLFIVPFSGASAALGSFICGTRLLAASTGVQGYDVGETATNFAINTLGAAFFGFVYWNDSRAREKDLVRIARSGKLSGLRVQLLTESGAAATLPLKAFRRNRRVVIIAGGPEVVALAQEAAVAGAEALRAAGAVVVPVLLPGLKPLSDGDVAALRLGAGLGPASPPPEAAAAADGESAGARLLSPCLAEAVGEAEWVEWMEPERRQAEEQGKDPARGLVVCVERTGYVKQRLLGVPDWRVLAAESARRNVPYGMPAFLTGERP